MGDMTGTATRARVSEIAEKIFNAAAIDTVPATRWQSQLRQVAHDLSRSVCEAAALRNDPLFADDDLTGDFVEEHVGRVRDILWAIPSAFHHYSLKTRDGQNVQPFAVGVTKMVEVAKDVIDIKPEDMEKAYGAVWTHVRALSEIDPNVKSRSLRDLCLHPSKDGVEYVAELYLAADDFVSRVLEWAIIDALVFSRIVDFASSCAFTGNLPDTPDGQMIDGPLLPGAGEFPMGKRPTPLQGFGIIIARSGIKLLVELLVLGVSWLVCELLADSDGMAKWILFSAITAARWVATAVKGNAAEREKAAKGETNLRMLWDMGIAHERVPAMNVGLLRHLFYRLEERGAALSPAVYAVLDKRARREAARDR